MAVKLSKQTTAKIDEYLTHYPVKQGALLPILHAVQDELGLITDEAADWVAQKTDVSPATVYGVVTFYPMFRVAPTGKYRIKVCATVPCAVCGSRELLAALKERLGVDIGGTTADGKFTLGKSECLAACHEAPVVLVNKKLYRKVTADRLDDFFAAVERDNPR